MWRPHPQTARRREPRLQWERDDGRWVRLQFTMSLAPSPCGMRLSGCHPRHALAPCRPASPLPHASAPCRQRQTRGCWRGWSSCTHVRWQEGPKGGKVKGGASPGNRPMSAVPTGTLHQCLPQLWGRVCRPVVHSGRAIAGKGTTVPSPGPQGLRRCGQPVCPAGHMSPSAASWTAQASAQAEGVTQVSRRNR